MADDHKTSASIFPRWANTLTIMLVLGAMGAPAYAVFVIWFGFSPKTTDVGYMPKQPVNYSHALHAGKLGIDCRYCHTSVEKTGFAAVPPTETCMNCHHAIRRATSDIAPDNKVNPEIAKIVAAWESGKPISWVKVHDLPDYAFFNHSAHVNKGVSCYECHGRVDKMEKVFQKNSLSMGWCLECHRDPAARLRPREEVFNLSWQIGKTDEERAKLGKALMTQYQIKTKLQLTDCSTCHR